MRALSIVESTALAKVGKVEDLGEGTHNVDFFVHVRGALKQGASYSQNIVAAANFQTLFYLALSKMNGTTAEFIANLATEALALEDNAEAKAKMEAELATIKATADAAVQKIKAATNRSCKGKLTAAVTAVVVPAEAVDKSRVAAAA